MSVNDIICYAKKITLRFRVDKSDEVLKIVSRFWNSNMIKVDGLRGFMLTIDPFSPELVTNITVWESKQAMDEFYSNCTNYSAVLEKNPKNDKW
jgi:quinol monooxygenase YgiN